MSDVIHAARVTVANDGADGAAEATVKPQGLARTAFDRWKRLAHAIGVVQTRLFLILFFFMAAFPLGLMMRASGDRLRLRDPGDSNWVAHDHVAQNLDTARRQY
jgi:hypothetical protein